MNPEMQSRKIKTNLFYRAVESTPTFEVIEGKSDDMVGYALSSEQPYERVFITEDGELERGLEVLDHSPECVDMARLMNGAPFLDQHNPDCQLGIIEKAELAPDKCIRVGVRFSKNPLPQERLRDIKDGIRKKCSIGYRVMTFKREKPVDENSLPVYRAVRWLPYEGSSVSIAADDSVGTGRSEKLEFETEILSEKKFIPVPEVPPAPVVEIKEIPKKEIKKMMDKKAIDEVRALAKGHGFSDADVIEFISDEKNTLETFQKKCLEKNHSEPVQNKVVGLGLKPQEKKRYSLANVLRAFSEPTSSKKEIGFELELSQEIQRLNGGVAPRSVYVPFDVFGAPSKRTGLNTTDATGGFTIQEDVMANEFIDVLRPQCQVIQAGARVMTGLRGNVLIPKLSASATCAWVAEDTANSESDQTFAGPTLTPKTLSGWTKVGALLMAQSSNNIEAIVREDLTRIFAIAIDKAALFGSGSSYQPTGIIKKAGPIASQLAWGTTATPSWANVVALESVVTGSDAIINSGAYITGAGMFGKLKYTPKVANQATFIYEGGKVNDYPCYRSTQFGSTTYGTTMMFGDFSQLIIGSWSQGVNLMIDPYTYSDTGALKITALMFADIQVRHEESFAFISDTTFS